MSDEEVSDKVLAQLADLLDATMKMELTMSENEVDYDIVYICQKLAKCSVFLERLSDAHLKVIQISVGVKNKLYRLQGQLRMAKVGAVMTGDTEIVPALEKDTETWNYVIKVVNEVKVAVKDRAQLMKRLDSDIRLHQKLLEDKVRAGGNTGVGYKGLTASDITL